MCHLGTHAGGNAVTHGAEACGADEVAGAFLVEVVCTPHLVLANAGDVVGVGAGQGANALQHVLGRTQAVGGLLVAERVILANLVQLVPPLTQVGQLLSELGGEQLGQLGQHVLQVANDRDVSEANLGDLGGVNVDVNDLGLGGEGVDLAGHAVVEAGTQGDEQVGLLHGSHCGNGAVHAGHAEVLGVGLGERTDSVQGGDDGGADELSQLVQLVGCASAHHATADVEDGALGLGDELGGFANLLGVAAGCGSVATQLEVLGDAAVFHHANLCILGDVHEHGAGATGGGDVEGCGERTGDVLCVGNHEGVLGDGHCHADNVSFLECVGTEQLGGNLTGDGDQGDGVHVGVSDCGQQVGGAGAGGCDAHAGLAAGDSVALSCVACSLLVTDQDVTNLLGIVQGIVGRQNSSTRQAENVSHTQVFEGADDCLRTGHAFCGSVCRVIRSGKSHGHGNASCLLVLRCTQCSAWDLCGPHASYARWYQAIKNAPRCWW